MVYVGARARRESGSIFKAAFPHELQPGAESYGQEATRTERKKNKTKRKQKENKNKQDQGGNVWRLDVSPKTFRASKVHPGRDGQMTVVLKRTLFGSQFGSSSLGLNG